MGRLWKGKARGARVGKRKVKSEDELSNIKRPVANDVIGIAKKMLGFDRVLVSCPRRQGAPLQNPRKDEEKNVDKAGRHRFGLSMGLPI